MEVIVVGIYAFLQVVLMAVTLIPLHIFDLLVVDRQNEMYILSRSLQLLTLLALSSSLLQLLWTGVSTTTVIEPRRSRRRYLHLGLAGELRGETLRQNHLIIFRFEKW